VSPGACDGPRSRSPGDTEAAAVGVEDAVSGTGGATRAMSGPEKMVATPMTASSAKPATTTAEVLSGGFARAAAGRFGLPLGGGGMGAQYTCADSDGDPHEESKCEQPPS
jgi:hypothetical protein